jgi:E3 ubiquitin-protein ligase HUWE1
LFQLFKIYFMDAGVPHLSPPDTDVEDHDDNGLGDAYEEDMVDEDEDEDEDDDWQEDQIIEVRWRDGLTGLNRVQVRVLFASLNFE